MEGPLLAPPWRFHIMLLKHQIASGANGPSESHCEIGGGFRQRDAAVLRGESSSGLQLRAVRFGGLSSPRQQPYAVQPLSARGGASVAQHSQSLVRLFWG